MSRNFVAAALLCLPALLATPISSAQACAMRRMEPTVVASNSDLVAAKLAEKKGEMAKALKIYEKVMLARGDNARVAEAALGAARLHLANGDSDKAIARLNRAVAVQPRLAQARLALAEALATERPDQAEEHLNLARTLGLRGAERQRMVAVAETIADAKALAAAPAVEAQANANPFPGI